MDAPIYLGTSAFTAAGWDTAFYPVGMKAADYLSYYATKFQAVEIDSTFYAAPAAATVTPPVNPAVRIKFFNT